jgi:hypothetical protein
MKNPTAPKRRSRMTLAESAERFLQDFRVEIATGDREELFRRATWFARFYGLDVKRMSKVLEILVKRGALRPDILDRWRAGGAERLVALDNVLIPSEVIVVGLHGIRVVPVRRDAPPRTQATENARRKRARR